MIPAVRRLADRRKDIRLQIILIVIKKVDRKSFF